MESVDVETLDTGEPVALTRAGRRWIVGAEPLRWFTRLPWWETTRRAPPGHRVRVDQEIWRVQVRLGRNPKSELLTLELIHHEDVGCWFVRPGGV